MKITPEEQLILERVRREWDIKGSLQEESKMSEFIVNIFRLGKQAGRRKLDRHFLPGVRVPALRRLRNDMIAWIAMLCTLASMYLAAKRNTWCWPMGMVGNALWFVYALWTMQTPIVLLNVVLFTMGLYGWKQWRKK